MVYERKTVDALTAADLERVKDPERNAANIASLREWIGAGKPKDRRPLSPKGDPIAKVRLVTKDRPGIPIVRGQPGDIPGTADRTGLVRADVFKRKNKKDRWEFFLVPVYRYQIFDEMKFRDPPSKAAVAKAKSEDDWIDIDNSFEFSCSLFPMSFVELEKADGTFIDGYFRQMDRFNAGLDMSHHISKEYSARGIGVKTLKSISKYQIDRLGRRTEIVSEKRTWRGAVCT